MKTRNPAVQPFDRSERKYRRFNLQYPVLITFQSAGSVTEVQAVTKNVSIGGLLVGSNSMIPQNTPVSFTIQVQRDETSRPIYLAGEGEVVRVETSAADQMSWIAVQCRAPIYQLEEYLPHTQSGRGIASC